MPTETGIESRTRKLDDVILRCERFDALGLPVYGGHMSHVRLSSRHSLGIEPVQELGLLFGQRAIHLQARVRPASDPLAVVQVGTLGRAVSRVRLMVAAAGAQRTRPAGRAVRLAVDVMTVEELLLPSVID